MKNEILTKVKSSILKDDLSEFALILKSEISIMDIGAVFNLFCEQKNLFPESKSPFIEFVICFAEIFPKYYFEHLNRLYYSNLNEIVNLIQGPLYLKFEYEFTDEIIKHLKTAYFFCSDKDLFLDRIEFIEFNNDRILNVIDELIILRNIQFSNNVEQIRKELSLFSWDLTLYSLCIFLEECGTGDIIKKTLEFIINKKPQGYFHGSDEDYKKILSGLKSNELNVKMDFAGKMVKVADLKKAFERQTNVFHRILYSFQIESITEDYCLRNNLVIKEKEKDCFEFNTIDFEKEELYQKDGIKYQIESDFFHLKNNEQKELKTSNSDLRDDYNLQLQLSIEKALIWLFSQGMIKTNNTDQLMKINNFEVPLNIILSFISVQCIHSKRLYGDVINKIGGKDAIEKLNKAYNEVEITGIDMGIPFHLRNIDDFENKFVKTFGNQEHIGTDFPGKCKNVLNHFLFDKDCDGKTPFSFDSHTHIKFGNKIFGFRKILSNKEPSHFAFNVLLNNQKSKEYNQDTSMLETNLIEGLKINGFVVLNDIDRKEIHEKYKIDFDVLAYKSGVIFSFEVKSTHFRRNLKEINLHTNRELMKAAYQLDKNVDFINKNPELIAKKLSISIEEIRNAIKKPYIVSTTMEEDHSFIGGHLKVGYFELMRTLYNEKNKLILPFLSSSNYYPNIYTSDLVNSFADAESESELKGRLNDLFISCNREEFLAPSQLIKSLENDTFWDFMEGIQYSLQKMYVKRGKLTVEKLNKYSIKSENITVVNRLLGI